MGIDKKKHSYPDEFAFIILNAIAITNDAAAVAIKNLPTCDNVSTKEEETTFRSISAHRKI